MHLVVQILLVVFSPAILGILTWFILEWRKAGSGGREGARLRQELAALRRDFEQSKAVQNDALLGLEAGMRRLEGRVDRLAGIEEPLTESIRQVPQERQL